MKNLVIQIVHRPDGGGAEFIARILAEEFNKENFDSWAIFFNNPKKVFLKENEFQLGNYSGYNPINFFKLIFFILKKTKNYNKVILHGHLTHALYFLIPLSYFKRFSLFYTEHNSFNYRRNFTFLRPLERYIYFRYEKVISISPYVKDQLINWIDNKKNILKRDKFLVVFNGTKLYPFIKRNYNKQKLNLLSIGRLTTQKGFELTINAVSELRDYVSNYFILGDGPKKESLSELILELKLGDIVKLKGFCDPYNYLPNCDIGLVPSKWEGFGLVSIEMVSSGMPLVISNARGMSNLFLNVETVKIMQDREISSWSSEIKSLIKNIHEFKERLEISSQFVSEFSVRNMVNNYKKEYLKIF